MTRNIVVNAAAAGRRTRKLRHAHNNRQDARTMLSTINAVRPSASQKSEKSGRAASASNSASNRPSSTRINTARGWQKSGRSAEDFGVSRFKIGACRRNRFLAYAQTGHGSSQRDSYA